MCIALATSICLFNNKKVLMLKKSNQHKLWGFPGGRVEIGESLFECAKRELQEETGIINVRWGKVYSAWYGFVENVHLHVIGICADTKEQNVKLCNENSDYEWWTFNDFLTRKNETYVNMDEVLNGWNVLNQNFGIGRN